MIVVQIMATITLCPIWNKSKPSPQCCLCFRLSIDSTAQSVISYVAMTNISHARVCISPYCWIEPLWTMDLLTSASRGVYWCLLWCLPWRSLYLTAFCQSNYIRFRTYDCNKVIWYACNPCCIVFMSVHLFCILVILRNRIFAIYMPTFICLYELAPYSSRTIICPLSCLHMHQQR